MESNLAHWPPPSVDSVNPVSAQNGYGYPPAALQQQPPPPSAATQNHNLPQQPNIPPVPQQYPYQAPYSVPSGQPASQSHQQGPYQPPPPLASQPQPQAAYQPPAPPVPQPQQQAAYKPPPVAPQHEAYQGPPPPPGQQPQQQAAYQPPPPMSQPQQQAGYQQQQQPAYQAPQNFQQSQQPVYQPPPPQSYQTQQQTPYQQSYQQQTPYQQPTYGSGPVQPQPLGRYPSSTPGPNNFGGGGPYQSANQQNRLDPEGMPSVVQVILEDKNKFDSSNNVLFTTTVPATVPPLVTTIMENDLQVVEDGGTARPNFLRPTIYQVPTTEDQLKTSDIPLGLVIKPFDDQEVEGKIYVPVTNSEIVRCNRCKSYMNPYNRFVDCGRRFQCSLCKHVTEVPAGYFANLDHTGQRLDKYQRPELFLGSYEFRATEEYCRNNIMNNRRPHIIFAVELTETSKPILSYLSSNLSEIIKEFPRDPLNTNSLPPLVGFVTYNSKIQLYDIVNNGQAHVVCDLSTPFPPLNTFLVDPLVHMDKIESFLKNLPSLYANEELEMQTILGPVIEAALLTTQVDVNNWFNQEYANKVIVDKQQNQTYETIPVGKVYLFHCTLPTYGNDTDTPGRLKPRWTNSIEEIRKLLGTDKEKTVLSPELNKYYLELGQKCVKDFASGVELFLFPPANGSFLDVATLGELTRLSGTGAVFKYFNDFSDAFLTDLKYSLNSSFAFDCILKVRTSTGIRPHDTFGNFHLSLPNDIECAAVNTNSSLVVDFKYDDKLPEDEHVVIQVAVLYTALSGERRVRLHNLALATCQQISDIYRNSCCDTIVNLIARNAVYNLRKGDKTIQQTKEGIVAKVINILTSYRRHCAQPGTSLGQLILPESLKLLPMYTCGILKCDAIDGGPEMNPDDKAFAQLKMLGSHPSLSQVFLYPRLYKIEYEDANEENLKYSQIRCSSYKLNAPALGFILENGFYVLLLITTSGCANVKFLNGLFGPSVDSAAKIQMELGLPNLLTNESQFVNGLFKKIESERKCSYKLFIIRQGIEKIETVFRSFLYEDSKVVTRNYGESKLEGLSYVDLLCHLHKEIRAQLN